MGLRIEIVKVGGRLTSVNALNPRIKYLNLQCGYCDAKVSLVRGHYKGNNKTSVRQHCRLQKNCVHGGSCKYNIERVLKDICAACGDSSIMTCRGESYTFRVLLLNEDLRDDSPRQSGGADDDNSRGYSPRFICVGRKTAYISTLKEILQLKNAFEEDSEFEDKIKWICFGADGKTVEVGWKYFFFDFERDFLRLYKFLQNKKPSYSFCLEGRVKKITKIKDELFCINFYGKRMGEREMLVPEIYFRNPRIFNAFESACDKKIIVFGDFSLREPKLLPTATFINLVCNVTTEEQIFIL